MSKIQSAIWICVATVSAAGCLPSTRVIKNPGDCDRGIRYYRPKPYLSVKPLINKAGEPVTGFVSLEQVVLPDFSEEYSIHIRTGLGSNNTSVSLTDGWRLDSINVELDSNFDQNLEALAEFAKVVPSLTASKDVADASMAVPASNVPIGLYESVVSKGCDGKKRLYGFRYVGFMPYSTCPLESCGSETQSCFDGQIYGLVFDGKQMAFKLLHGIPESLGTKPAYSVDKSDLETLPNPPDDSMLDDDDHSSRFELESLPLIAS